MDQVKFVEDSLKNQTLSRPYPFKFFKGSPANFTWSILEYFVPFSQLLPIYQICVAKRNFSLRKVVFFYSVRLNFFSTLRVTVTKLLYSCYLYSGYHILQDYTRKVQFFTNVSCDVLRDLVPFVQFKRREKHSWRSGSKVAVSKVSLQFY